VAENENRAAVERLWRAFVAREFERAGDEVHEDVVVDWPHSGERIRGRAHFVAVNRDHPDPWITVELRRVVSEGDLVVTEVAVPVAGAPTVYAASFFEFEHGKVRRLTEYWVDGGSQQPHESRAGISETMEA
jgi:ketosteroid isomerase-like protein